MIASKLFVVAATALVGMAAAHHGLIEERGIDGTCVTFASSILTVTVTKCESAPNTPPTSSAAAPPPDKSTATPGVPLSSEHVHPTSTGGNPPTAPSGPVTSASEPATASEPASQSATGSGVTSTSITSTADHSSSGSSTQKAPPPITPAPNGAALPTSFPGIVVAGIVAMAAVA